MKHLSHTKRLLAMMLSAVLAFGVIVGCGKSTAGGNPPKILYDTVIPNGQVGVLYDFEPCFTKEESVTYSIIALYNTVENGEFVDKALAVTGFTFTPLVKGSVYVALTAERGKHKVVGDEVVITVIAAGDESKDLLTDVPESINKELEWMSVLERDTANHLPGALVDEENITSANSLRAKRLNIPMMGPGSGVGGNRLAELYYRISPYMQWWGVDLREAVLVIDVFTENMGSTLTVKFEASLALYGNYVVATLADGAEGTGWTVAAVPGKAGWFRVTIVCADADLDRFEVNTGGMYEGAAVDELVQVWGLEDVHCVRFYVSQEGRDPDEESYIVFDNFTLDGMKKGLTYPDGSKTKYTDVAEAFAGWGNGMDILEHSVIYNSCLVTVADLANYGAFGRDGSGHNDREQIPADDGGYAVRVHLAAGHADRNLKVTVYALPDWTPADLSQAVFTLDIKPGDNLGDGLRLYFEGENCKYAGKNLPAGSGAVSMTLGDGTFGTGWSSADIGGGWYRLTVDCAALASTVATYYFGYQVFGIDWIKCLRFAFDILDTGDDAFVDIDNFKIRGIKASAGGSVSPYDAEYDRVLAEEFPNETSSEYMARILAGTGSGGISGYSSWVSGLNGHPAFTTDEDYVSEGSNKSLEVFHVATHTSYPTHYIDTVRFDIYGTYAPGKSNNWVPFDLSGATLTFDIYPGADGRVMEFYLESQDGLYGDVLSITLNTAASQATGVTVAAVPGFTDWYRVTIDIGAAKLDTKSAGQTIFGKDYVRAFRMTFNWAASLAVGATICYLDNMFMENEAQSAWFPPGGDPGTPDVYNPYLNGTFDPVTDWLDDANIEKRAVATKADSHPNGATAVVAAEAVNVSEGSAGAFKITRTAADYAAHPDTSLYLYTRGSQWQDWCIVDYTDATLSLDVKPFNTTQLTFYFTGPDGFLSEGVAVNLGGVNTNPGVTCTALTGDYAGWYRVVIVCKDAGFERSQNASTMAWKLDWAVNIVIGFNADDTGETSGFIFDNLLRFDAKKVGTGAAGDAKNPYQFDWLDQTKSAGGGSYLKQGTDIGVGEVGNAGTVDTSIVSDSKQSVKFAFNTADPLGFISLQFNIHNPGWASANFNSVDAKITFDVRLEGVDDEMVFVLKAGGWDYYSGWNPGLTLTIGDGTGDTGWSCTELSGGWYRVSMDIPVCYPEGITGTNDAYRKQATTIGWLFNISDGAAEANVWLDNVNLYYYVVNP